ncbi:MAG: glycosyltransferase family 39 protein, partial [Candidatus Omnitrophica bacterium]|nr:glycosyltransferase family 39 protein [Candidatus Omnitrophota bacterium]
NSEQIVFRARLMILFVAVFGGIFLFYWINKRVSYLAAIFALFLYCFSPNILAHARLATTDMVSTVFIMCSIMTFWDLLTRESRKRIILCGIFLGLALLSKFTALLLLPVYAVVYIFQVIMKRGKGDKRLRVRSVLGVLLISFMIMWIGYGFEGKPILSEDTMRLEEKTIIAENMIQTYAPGFKDKWMYLLRNVPVPMSSYLVGVLGVIKHGAEGARVLFMGKWSEKGNPFYYVVAMLIKTPISLFLFFLLGCLRAFYSRYRKLVLYLLFITGLFIVSASSSDLQLGLRYILPVYPLIFIISAIGLKRLISTNLVSKRIAIVLLLWYAVSSIMIWPNYLSYFNEIIGGPSNGYKYLGDSNLDWGQNLPALKKFMTKKKIDRIALHYFDTEGPVYYGIKCDKISEEEMINPKNKVYAISVDAISSFKWTKGIDPVAKVGYTFFIYDFRQENNKDSE